MLVVQQVSRAFHEQMPLVFAEELLAGWPRGWWTTGERARLRVLLCDAAFEAGVEVKLLTQIGLRFPALGEALGVNDPLGLTQLRLLWSLRPTRPWDRCGPATTVFELAGHAERGSRLLDVYPDLLLYDSPGNVQSDSPILVCGRGLIFQGQLFSAPPDTTEVLVRHNWYGTRYEVTLGRHRFPFPFNPDALTHRLERWFHYFFRDFQPQMTAVLNWPSQVEAGRLFAAGPLRCPDCRVLFKGSPGSVGFLMEDDRPSTNQGS
jgi:hypothetical protein